MTKTVLLAAVALALAGCAHPNSKCSQAAVHVAQFIASTPPPAPTTAKRYWWRIGYAAALVHFRLHPPKPAHCVTHKQNTLCKAPNDVAIPAGPQ